jgi:hypothetical protein
MAVPQSYTTEFGIRVYAPGYITPKEMRIWFEELKPKVQALGGKPFGLLSDIRTQRANPPESQEVLKEALIWLRHQGLTRSVVVLDSMVALIQTLRLSKVAGLYDTERYLDASKEPDWEQKALDWLTRSVDPDLGVAGQPRQER